MRNEADMLVYRTEKMLKDNADKISGDKKKQIEDAIAAVKEALKGSDVAAIKRTDETAKQVPGRQRRALQAGVRAGRSAPRPQPGPEAQPGGGAEEGQVRTTAVTSSTREVVDENKKK